MVYLELGSCTYGVFGNCTCTFIVWALAQMVLPPFIRLGRGWGIRFKTHQVCMYNYQRKFNNNKNKKLYVDCYYYYWGEKTCLTLQSYIHDGLVQVHTKEDVGLVHWLFGSYLQETEMEKRGKIVLFGYAKKVRKSK